MGKKIAPDKIEVRNKNDLFKCDGLIIPGGESTTMSKLLDYKDLRKSILEIKGKNLPHSFAKNSQYLKSIA